MTATTRDPELPRRLLLAERDALLPILRSAPPGALDRPTCLPGWSVRDVLAHCAAAFTMTVNRSWHGFSPEENQRDVDERRGLPVEDVLAELESGYAATAEAAAAANGALDGLALGGWLHGGDVREALDRPDAYTSSGADDALVLLIERSRQPERRIPRTTVSLSGRSDVILGSTGPEASLCTDTGTLFRLCAGRQPDPGRYELTGAGPSSYVLFD
ncbi:MAG: maleylpyruvate isomerase family mycothiol-dependent enzyme [Nocardioidaceae bacterium]